MHLAGGVAKPGVKMRGGVVEKVANPKGDVFPVAGGDGRCNGADGSLHCIVDCARIVVENARKFLAVFGLGRGELTRGNWFCKLLFLAVDRC